MSHSLQVILLLMVVVAAAKLAGALATRVHQPSVFGEILAGVLLGPSVLNVLGWPMFAAAEPDAIPLLALVQDLAHLGVLLLMFVAGLETDLDQLRNVGRVAFWVAFGGVLLPLIGGAAVSVAFGLPLYWEGIFVGTILTATSVSISAQTLLELGALRTREGATILGAAVIDDVMGIVLLSVVVALASVSGGVSGAWSQIPVLLIRIALFFAGAVAGARALPFVMRWTSQLGVSQAVLAAAIVIMCAYAWFAEYVGAVAAITGAYVAGVVLARTEFKSEIDRGIHPLTYSMFVPMFFISIGLEANARDLGPRAMFTVVLVVVAIVAKMIGSGVFARIFGLSNRESVRVGIGMISRGEVGLIVAGYALAHGAIGQDVFSASVMMVLATTVVTPPLLRLVFPHRVGTAVIMEETIGHTPEEAA
jgi:Kef-type K+ transport system membrane component KefB